MPGKIQVTGLKGGAAPAGPSLVRIVFQLSAAPVHEWGLVFTTLARELARGQNHGIRPGFRFSYRLDADTVQVNCPMASFIAPVKGKNIVVQAVVDLVAKVNLLANQSELSSLETKVQMPESAIPAGAHPADESK